MKVLYIIPEEYNGKRWGGVTSYTVTTAKKLSHYGHAVSILTPGKSDEKFVQSGVTFYKIKVIPPKSVSYKIVSKVFGRLFPNVMARICWAINIKDFIKKHTPAWDIIEAPEWGSSTALLSRSTQSKIITRLHRSWYQYTADNLLPTTLEVLLIDLIEHWCLINSHGITSPTKFMLNTYKKLNWVLRKRKILIRLIPYGIELPKKVVGKKKTMHKNFILTVGRVEIGKGSLVLVKAFSKIAKSYPHIKLLFIGEDTKMYLNKKWQSTTGFIKKTLIKKGLDGKVIFLKRKVRDRLAAYYSGCLFYVAPSRGHENPSICIIEAMAHRKTVVGANTGGIPEVVIHKENGLLFEPDNVIDLSRKLALMIGKKDFRQACEAKINIESSDINKTAKKTVNFYVFLSNKNNSY